MKPKRERPESNSRTDSLYFFSFEKKSEEGKTRNSFSYFLVLLFLKH